MLLYMFLCDSLTTLKNPEACSQTLRPSWSESLDFCVFANGKWVFSHRVDTLTRQYFWQSGFLLAVYSASRDLHAAFSRVVLTHDSMEHIWEKCVRNFPAPSPPLCRSSTPPPICTHDRINCRDSGFPPCTWGGGHNPKEISDLPMRTVTFELVQKCRKRKKKAGCSCSLLKN